MTWEKGGGQGGTKNYSVDYIAMRKYRLNRGWYSKILKTVVTLSGIKKESLRELFGCHCGHIFACNYKQICRRDFLFVDICADKYADKFADVFADSYLLAHFWTHLEAHF